jgi:hypothetical protein
MEISSMKWEVYNKKMKRHIWDEFWIYTNKHEIFYIFVDHNKKLIPPDVSFQIWFIQDIPRTSTLPKTKDSIIPPSIPFFEKICIHKGLRI